MKITYKVIIAMTLAILGCERPERDSPVKEYYPNGSLKSSYVLTDSLLDGERVDYYENGNIYRKATFKKGVMVDSLLVYFEDGQLFRSMMFKNGLLHGHFLEYDEDGALRNELNYLNNKLSGTALSYYPSGSLYISQQIYDSLRHGEYLVFSDNSDKLIEAGTYVLGKRDGIYVVFHPNGKPKDSIYFDMGEWIESDSYDSSGEYTESKRLVDDTR